MWSSDRRFDFKRVCDAAGTAAENLSEWRQFEYRFLLPASSLLTPQNKVSGSEVVLLFAIGKLMQNGVVASRQAASAAESLAHSARKQMTQGRGDPDGDELKIEGRAGPITIDKQAFARQIELFLQILPE
jgi:hypothetical protein